MDSELPLAFAGTGPTVISHSGKKQITTSLHEQSMFSGNVDLYLIGSAAVTGMCLDFAETFKYLHILIKNDFSNFFFNFLKTSCSSKAVDDGLIRV